MKAHRLMGNSFKHLLAKRQKQAATKARLNKPITQLACAAMKDTHCDYLFLSVNDCWYIVRLG